MPDIRVALADDHPIVLAGLTALIQAASDMRLVGQATDGEAAFELIKAACPDVAVLDLSMPKMGGVEVAKRLADENCGTKVLILTVHEDSAYLQQLLRLGVRGYLLKRSAADELVRAIRAVQAGGLFVDPIMASKLLTPSLPADPDAVSVAELSGREEAVLRLVARGFSNKEAAAKLALSAKTVETYKARALEKLGLRTRAEVVRYAAKRDWLEQS
jgi:DNA-binding NarL/FixJ family response regulator